MVITEHKRANGNAQDFLGPPSGTLPFPFSNTEQGKLYCKDQSFPLRLLANMIRPKNKKKEKGEDQRRILLNKTENKRCNNFLYFLQHNYLHRKLESLI